jgi:hypothetical protein
VNAGVLAHDDLMGGWMRRILVYLMPWYDERSQLERLSTSHRKLVKAVRIQRDAAMRADAARAQSRMAGRS